MKEKDKTIAAGVNLIRMFQGGYVECDVRVCVQKQT